MKLNKIILVFSLIFFVSRVVTIYSMEKSIIDVTPKRHFKYQIKVFSMDIWKNDNHEYSDYHCGYYAVRNFLNEMVCDSRFNEFEFPPDYEKYLDQDLKLSLDNWIKKAKKIIGKNGDSSRLNLVDVIRLSKEYGLSVLADLIILHSYELQNLKETDALLQNKLINDYRTGSKKKIFILFCDGSRWVLYQFLRNPSKKSEHGNIINVFSLYVFDSLNQVRIAPESLLDYVFRGELKEQEPFRYDCKNAAKKIMRENIIANDYFPEAGLISWMANPIFIKKIEAMDQPTRSSINEFFPTNLFILCD